MADYCNIRAPQWIDFTQNCSPMQVQDFFEKEHTVHERIEEPCNSTTDETMENAQSVSQMDILCVNPQAQADLDIIKSTPVKVISPKYRNKETVVAEGSYEQVFNDAMRKLELCKNMSKTRDAKIHSLNKSTQEPKIFKTPNMPKITKSSRSVGSVLNKNNQSNQDFTKVNKISNNYMKNLTVKQLLLEQDKNFVEDNTFKKSNNSDNTENNENKQCNEEGNEECKEEGSKECKEEDSKECEEEDNKEDKESSNNKEHNEEDKKLQDGQIECVDDNNDKKAGNSQNDIDAKNNRTQPTKHVAVLTWQNHRRNMHKRRTSVNKQYIGLAEAVSRFQTETPKRFRTKSNKDNTISPSFYTSKLTQNRLKPTIPISPVLTTKTRIRPVTVLSQEEREMLEIEEMKYRVKANPVPSNVLRGPRATMKVNNFTRKSMVTTNTSSAIQPNEKTKSSSHSKSPHRDKMPSGLKNTIPNVIVSDSEGIIVEHEAMAFLGVPKNPTKNVTRIVPFSFEARNKDMQMKKEQRLKNLQEANRVKAEFHARPAPNFSKPSTSNSTRPSTPSVKQQQNAKKLNLPCPFSFEGRNRKLSEKKEQLAKQVLEEDKQFRVFRANPAPVFKPVMVRGRSKEHLSVKNKNMKTKSEHNAEYKCEDQENKKPNEIDSYKTVDENIQRAASSACNDDKLPLKALPLELNTDKRAIKRREFEDKLKYKEMEEEMKRQEQEKKRLEHEKQLKAELRKLAEIKARPMPKYKPLITVKSTKQLTNPQSPAFVSKLRSKQV